MVEELARFQGVTPRVEASLDRRAMLRGADYVFTTFQQGGLRAFELDIEIPQRYGVEQCVGDTLGPGGVFRGLRTIPVLLDICRELDEVAPRALLLNYVNPMGMNCWAIDRGSGRPHVACPALCAVDASALDLPRGSGENGSVMVTLDPCFAAPARST